MEKQFETNENDKLRNVCQIWQKKIRLASLDLESFLSLSTRWIAPLPLLQERGLGDAKILKHKQTGLVLSRLPFLLCVADAYES